MLLIDALKLAGYGRFHVYYYFVTTVLLIICGAHINLNLFIAYDPLHRCKVPDGANWTELVARLPLVQGVTVYDACNVYNWTETDNGTFIVDNTTKQACPMGMQYLEGISTQTVTEAATDYTAGPTLTTDYHITCNTGYQWAMPGLSALAIWPSQHMSLPFMDKIGRKALCVVLFTTSGLLLCITPYVGSFWNMWVIRMITRCFMQVAYLAVTRHVVEIHPMDERQCSTALLVSGYSCGHLFLAILQWCFNSNWRKVDYAVSVCTLVWAPVVFLFYPESPLFWAVNVNREREAEKVVRRIAYWNGVKLPIDFTVDQSPMLTNVLERTPSRWSTYLMRSWVKVWYNPFIFRRWSYATLAWAVMNYVWVATSVMRLLSPMYYIFNYAMMALAVMAGGAVTQMLLRVFKRMELAVVYMLLSSIPFFLDAAINAQEGGYMTFLHVTPAYQARGFFYAISAALSLCCLGIIRLQSAEIRGEECQPGAMFCMLSIGTFFGAIAMYFPMVTRQPVTVGGSKMGLWLCPMMSGLAPLIMGVVTRIWYYDLEYMEDCRWRELFFRKVRRRERVPPDPPMTAKQKDKAMRDKRLSITSAAAT